jgi:hypothetical protein
VIVLAIAIALPVAGVSARDLAPGELVVTTCDGAPAESVVTEELARAIGLELDDVAGPLELRISMDCPEETARVVVAERATSTLVERTVPLAPAPPHLRARVIALVCSELVRMIARTAAAESRAAPAVQEETTSPPPLPSRAGPAASAEQLAPADEERILDLEASGGARFFFSGAASVLAMGELSMRWGFVRVGARFGGAPATSPFAEAQTFVASGLLGIVFGVREERLEGALEVFAEVGAAVTTTRSTIAGYTGTVRREPIVGGSTRVSGRFRVSDALALAAAIDLGAVYGVEIDLFGEPLVSIHGLSLAVQAGVVLSP